MNDTFTTDSQSAPILVRAATTDYDEAPGWQRIPAFAMHEDRDQALRLALSQRVKDFALEVTLGELLVQGAVRNGDAIVTRHWGRHGYIEVTVLEADAPLEAMYLRLSARPPEEAEVVVDELIDSAVGEREQQIIRVQITDEQIEVDGQIGLPLPATEVKTSQPAAA